MKVTWSWSSATHLGLTTTHLDLTLIKSNQSEMCIMGKLNFTSQENQGGLVTAWEAGQCPLPMFLSRGITKHSEELLKTVTGHWKEAFWIETDSRIAFIGFCVFNQASKVHPMNWSFLARTMIICPWSTFSLPSDCSAVLGHLSIVISSSSS